MDCPSCNNLYEEDLCEPRILIGCGHSICINCIREHGVKTEDNNLFIKCAECDKETQAPDE